MSLRAGRAGALALAAALAVLLVGAAVPALAHAELVSSDQADGARLAQPPTTVTLTFSEGLDAAKSSFQLNHAGATVGTGKAAADGDTTMTLTGLALEPGNYVVRIVAAADDGHIERSSIGFVVLEPTPTPAPTATEAASPTVNPTDDVTESPSPTTQPTAAPSEPQVTPSAAPSPDPDSSGSTSGGDVLLPILVGLVLIGGVGAFLFRRSRQA